MAFTLCFLFHKRKDLQLKPYCGMDAVLLQIELGVNRVSFAARMSRWLSVIDKLACYTRQIHQV